MSLIAGLLWQDLVLSVGGAVGTISKIDALQNEDTVWPLRASLPNAILYMPTIYAFYTLGMYLMVVNTSISFFIWVGIAIFRRPSGDSDS